MKKLILIKLILLGILSLPLGGAFSQKTTSIVPYPTPINPVEKAGWELIFQDEFEIDTLKSHWWPQTGLHGDESQWYTIRSENVFVKDGQLHLKAIRENYKDSFDFTSGMVYTSTSFGRGTYAEIRCKIPKGKGLWPAFWFNGSRKGYQEIDVFEFWSHNTKRYAVTNHYWDTIKQKRDGEYSWITPRTQDGDKIDMSEDFFTYAVYWDDTGIYYLLNNMLVEKQTQNIPSDPFPLILNLAVEGGKKGKYKPKKSLVFPKEFLIDYVRLYKKTKKIE
jgi:beta-glucanase (GH16 family)